MSASALNDLPEVPISVFKANPAAFADTGAVVLVHGQPRLRVTPIAMPSAPSIAEVKTRLRLLNELVDPVLAEAEARELARERDADVQDTPR